MANHILVIGGSSGIGLASAKRFLSGGWRVTIAGRCQGRLDRAKVDLEDVNAVILDASDRESLHDALLSVSHLNAVVTTAGSDAGGGAFDDLGSRGLLEAVRIKAGAQLNVLEATRRAGLRIDAFTFTSGAAARKGGPGMAPLTAANAALEALVPVLAKELAPLRVNAVSPGFVDTPLYDGMPEAARAELIGSMAKATPTGKIATVHDVAESIWFATTNSSVNGAVIPVDGGV